MKVARLVSSVLIALAISHFGQVCLAQQKFKFGEPTVLSPISIEEGALNLDGDCRGERIRRDGDPLIARYAQVAAPAPAQVTTEKPTTTFKIRIDRGADLGQSFGSLFEVISQDGSLVIGAGFQNVFNSFYRGDRHALQFYIRPTDAPRAFHVETLPRPNDLCGTYLFSRDGVVYSTYGGLKSWDEQAKAWRSQPEIGGTQESMRVGDGVLEFGNSLVKYKGRTILRRPSRGNYQLFFYANGHLCFYHVDRGAGAYRPYENDADGFSKLYACPWTSEQSEVDLSKAIIKTLPVVGETTFAWGDNRKQIVTGSNVGGFYVFEDGQWRMLLEPNIKVSYQLYSTMAFHDRHVLGQYPTGRLFQYDGKSLAERAGWPPVLPGVSSSAREAQTTVTYGGELLVGVWPWGELWRYESNADRWNFIQRMFNHPELSDTIVHPYDVENRTNSVGNQWGQRVTSLVTSGDALFVATSAKDPCKWDAERYPFLAPEKWKSYGTVYRLTSPGSLGANVAWTNGPTTLELTLSCDQMAISQDGKLIATTAISGPFTDNFKRSPLLGPIKWGQGIHGRFSGHLIEVAVRQ